MKLNKILAVGLPVALVLMGAAAASAQISGYEVVTRELPPGSPYEKVGVDCPNGKVVVGGGCSVNPYQNTPTLMWSFPFHRQPAASDGWSCAWIPESITNQTTQIATAICADGDGGSTQPVPTIVSSNPPDGAIMAQDSTGSGFDGVGLDFSDSLGEDFGPDIFTVTGFNDTNSVIRVRWAFSNNYALDFARPLVPGERLRITHNPSGSSVCIGFLPGDVDQSGSFTVNDVAALYRFLNSDGAGGPSYAYDINRDGAVSPKDLTDLNALLNTNTPKFMRPCSQVTAAVSPVNQTASAYSIIDSLLSKFR